MYLDKSQIEVSITIDSTKASSNPESRSMVRFNANIDWHQSHEFLKFEMPVDIHSENATYDIQFGTIQRPTHRNTTYDQEKFEVCAHKFADLSEYGYGVAIINDSKYGHAVDGNVMRLSLLRSPKNPDPSCDMHKHEINWAVYPHVGTFAESDVTQAAYAFNAPLKRERSQVTECIHFANFRSAVRSSSPSSRVKTAPATSITVSARNVILETIKRGEQDRDGKTTSIIVRLYEKFGGHARPLLKVKGLDVQKAEIVNILEDHVESLDCVKNVSEGGCEIPLEFRGFEIKTVRLTVAREDERTDNWVEL